MNKVVLLLLLIALVAVQTNAMPADAKAPAKDAAKDAKGAAEKGANAGADDAKKTGADDANKTAAKGAAKNGGGIGKAMEGFVDDADKGIDSMLDLWGI